MFRAQAAENNEFLARACDGDVEPPFPTRLVQRAEVHRHAAGLIGSVGEREQHDVALLALHALKVLNQHRLDGVVGEKRLQARILAARLVQQVQDQRLLLGVEGDDADGGRRPTGQDSA